MRYLIGIDAAKAKNDIAIFNSDMGLVRKPFTVSQSQSDIQKLAKSFAAIDGDVRAVVESTGRYHLPIVEQLSKERIFVSVVNPKLIKQFGDNSLRNVKNDPADAKKICRYGILNWDSLREYTNMDELRTQLQLYNSQFEFFTSQKVSVKSNLIALLDMTYPGINQLFNSPVDRMAARNGWITPNFSGMWTAFVLFHSMPLAKSTDIFVKSRAITSNKASVNHSTLQPRILSRSFQKMRNTRLW